MTAQTGPDPEELVLTTTTGTASTTTTGTSSVTNSGTSPLTTSGTRPLTNSGTRPLPSTSSSSSSSTSARLTEPSNPRPQEPDFNPFLRPQEPGINPFAQRLQEPVYNPFAARAASQVQTVDVSTSSTLADIPHVYLMDRTTWSDFKRACNNCGLIWNIPDWMHTVVHHGEDYKKVQEAGEDLDVYFPHAVVQVEGKTIDVQETSKRFTKLLGFPETMNEYIRPGAKYCNLNTLTFEAANKLPARQKFWTWMVKCLYGSKATPGPYHYLTMQCQTYDISHLFRRLFDVMETVTICSLDDEVYTVTHMDFDPATQDLFAYLEDLRKAMRRLDDLNERLPHNARVTFPPSYLRSRLVRASVTRVQDCSGFFNYSTRQRMGQPDRRAISRHA